MSEFEKWVVIFLAVALITILVSYVVFSKVYAMPEYIPLNTISV